MKSYRKFYCLVILSCVVYNKGKNLDYVDITQIAGLINLSVSSHRTISYTVVKYYNKLSLYKIPLLYFFLLYYGCSFYLLTNLLV